MSTPILTKKQQRQSLSTKKGPSRGLRNILAQPVENYWPTVNIDQCQALMVLMNKLLPSIRRATFKIPGSILRHTTKEKRASIRQEALEKESIKPDGNMLKSVIIGINAVTKALEKNKICCILLDANVEPPLLIKHIVIMAQTKKVPLLLLPTLKTITLQTIGFATAALALKNNVMQSLDNMFHALYQSVIQVFQDLPSKCLLQLFKPDKTSAESTTYETEIANINYESVTNISKTEKLIFTDVYKYRSSRTERAFVPPIIGKDGSQVSLASNEFISLDNNSDFINDKDFNNILKNRRYVDIQKKDEYENLRRVTACDNETISTDKMNSGKHTENHISKKCKDDVTYLSLKIKRIRGNNNRIKATKFAKKKKK